jgi:hypothetical protein
MKKVSLTSPERDFFEKIMQAVFVNPFSDARETLDHEIAGLIDRGAVKDARQKGLSKLEAMIHGLDRRGAADFRRYSGRDRELAKYAFLFEAYHRFVERIDEHIVLQIRSGEDPVPVPFSGVLRNLLESKGFSREEALWFFALFFQFRRAYFFIERRMIGRSDSMRRLRCALWDNVFTRDPRVYERRLWSRMEDFSTLLLGETGTGKGTAAAAIGRSGFIPFDVRKNRFCESFTRTFIATNLSRFSEGLIESELFGHKKGAFTGAVESHTGLFGRSSPYGSIFLDEIGEVSIPIQIKLLKILEERTFSPVGSYEKRRFSGRVIAATNRPLDRMIRQGRFRDDFYYRLCSDRIEIPPLRRRIAECPSELEDMVAHAVHKITGQDDSAMAETVAAGVRAAAGDDYPWPGNVRELEQCVRRILLRGSAFFDLPIKGGSGAPFLESVEAMELDARGLLSGYCRRLYRRFKTYEEVSRKTGLDRRTVKKYIGGGVSGRPNACP